MGTWPASKAGEASFDLGVFPGVCEGAEFAFSGIKLLLSYCEMQDRALLIAMIATIAKIAEIENQQL
jgi:hypothetical protein